MTDTTTTPTAGAPAPSRSDRTGAIWVTATGALLLFAAAATFVAVRWDHLVEWQKFAALVAVTQVFLTGGWLGRRRVPATAAALFSLGAVLVPLDAWTVAASGGGWRRGLFVGGMFGVVSIPMARRLFDTVALRWSWLLTVPVAAAGVAAFTGLPAPGLLVAALGVVALTADRCTEGRCWLLIGAVAPTLGLIEGILPLGRGVLADLGLTGPSVPWAATATAVIVAGAVALEGMRNRRNDLVAVGSALALVDVGLALGAGHATTSSWLFTAAALFLGVECLASVTATDRFWAPLTRPTARALEWATAGAAFLLASATTARISGTGLRVGMRPTVVCLTAAVVVIAWLVADERAGRIGGRSGRRHLLTGEASLAAGWSVATWAAISLAWAPIDGVSARIVLIAVGALLLVGRRSAGSVTGTTLALAALVTDRIDLPYVALGAAALAVVAVGAAVQRERAAATLVSFAGGLGLFCSAVAVLVATGWSGPGGHGWTAMQVLGATAALGLALGSIAAGRCRAATPAIPFWIVATLALGGSLLAKSPVWCVAATFAGLLWWTVEALRRGDALTGAFATLASPIASGSVLFCLDVADRQSGVGMAIAAIVLVGIAMVVVRSIRPFLLVGAGLHILAALLLASPFPGPFGVVLTIAGLLLVAVAILQQSIGLAYNGFGLALIGSWQALFGYDVGSPEAYLAPLAFVLLLAGVHARSVRTLSSWVAYAPPVLVLGGGALALRFHGDPGWHGIIAGAVGVAAVAIGSWRRLAGPLFCGSAILATITFHETITRTAGAPTWIWLAAGGCVLVGAGIAMELRGLGPVESGKRLVELVGERFD